jgi:hypothetical protein
VCLLVASLLSSFEQVSLYDRGVLFRDRAVGPGGIFVGSVFIDGTHEAFPRLRRSVAVFLRRRPRFAP